MTSELVSSTTASPSLDLRVTGSEERRWRSGKQFVSKVDCWERGRKRVVLLGQRNSFEKPMFKLREDGACLEGQMP